MLSILSALFPRYAAPRKGDCIGKRRYLSEKRRGPFQFIFFLRNFFYDFRRIRLPPPTASVSAPSRHLCAQPTGKLRQSTQPGGNGQNNPAAHRVSPPKKENENFGRPKRLRYLSRLSFQYPSLCPSPIKRLKMK